MQIRCNRPRGFTKRLVNYIRPCPHCAGGIWKRRFHSEIHLSITSHFGFVFEESSVKEITWLSWRHRFGKAPFSQCFPSTRKRKVVVFKFLRFEQRFRIAFLWRTSVGGRPSRRKKDAFLIFSGVLWTPSQSAEKYVYMNFSKQRPHKRTPAWVGFVLFFGHCNCCRCTRGRVATLVRSHVNGLILFERKTEQTTETICPLAQKQ